MDFTRDAPVGKEKGLFPVRSRVFGKIYEARVPCNHFHVFIVNTLLVFASIFLSTLYRVLRVGRIIRTKILARRLIHSRICTGGPSHHLFHLLVLFIKTWR